jgi:cytochrome c oxidase subunit 2
MWNVLRKTLVGAAGALLATTPALADWELNMPVGVTEISRDVHRLHMLIFWICVAIAVAVFGAMIYSIARFRQSKGAVADTTLTHSTKVEIIWTIIPIGILVGMAIPAAESLVKIEDTRDSDLTIKVTGYQWKWHYDYLDEGVQFFSTLADASDAARRLDSGVDPFSVENYLLEVDNPLVVPVGAKVRLLLTANDVIHAWWVPQFGMKRDAIPGFINEMWFRADQPGVYRGQCAELCGRDHGFMPVVVEVRSRADYDTWLAGRQESRSAEGSLAADDAAAPTGQPGSTDDEDIATDVVAQAE